MLTPSTKTVLRQLQHPIPDANLYQPEKYKVHTGIGSVGFCTGWNEPETTVKIAPSLHIRAALIGSLYSNQGVNVIVRNLALNPFIKRVYLWGHGQLSNTKFGTVGTSVLKELWQQGTHPSFRLDKEIDLSIFEIMRQHVELIDVGQEELPAAIAKIKPTNLDPYMRPVRFPDAAKKELVTFSSEQVGWLIHGPTVITAWTRVVERIMRYGLVKGTQYGSQQKELLGVTWVIHNENPNSFHLPDDWPLSLQELTGATLDAIDEYHQVFLSPDKPAGASYTYGNRLMRYPLPGKGKREVDQITESIIGNLKASPDTRRAVATTLVPWIDATSDQPPCITQVQCIQAGGKVNMLVTVRSHDIFKAAIPNAFGLRVLQARIAKETGYLLGSLQITSQSAHIYEGDWNNANQLAACSFWDRPGSPVTEADFDPRGTVSVRLAASQIVVTFLDPDNQILFELKGTSSDQLVRDISQHEPFSRTNHALDIGVQLARAEVALKNKLPFTQDKLVQTF
ncbi:MAG: thymidylate synthase [bacterium]